jgi:hypothetical protein
LPTGIVVVRIILYFNHKIFFMIKLALMATLKAKEGKEAEVEKFLRDALPLVENEPATSTWYALRLDEETFLIFDTFTDEKGRACRPRASSCQR